MAAHSYAALCFNLSGRNNYSKIVSLKISLKIHKIQEDRTSERC